MTKEIINCKIKQNREKYEEKLDAICDIVKDIVPLKIRISFKKRKMRLFDAVVNRQGRKPNKRKLRISESEWFGIYQNLQT